MIEPSTPLVLVTKAQQKGILRLTRYAKEEQPQVIELDTQEVKGISIRSIIEDVRVNGLEEPHEPKKDAWEVMIDDLMKGTE